MNWDDARYFLAVARHGQMLGAARQLGVSQARLSRRVASLEEATGARLLDRSPRGCSLTASGQRMFEAAERVEAEMLGASAELSRSEDDLSGTVRIGAPDGFGSAYLAPRLGRLRESYPALQVQLVPMPRSFSLSQREADLAIMVGRPERGRLRVKRLTDYSLGLYAARSYVARVGAPAEAGELSAYDLIGYVEDLIYTPELQYASEFSRDWHSDIEVSTAIGQLEVVRSGAGIGILHDFMAADDPSLVRILPKLSARRTYWIALHENMRSIRRVAAVADFLSACVREERARFLPIG